MTAEEAVRALDELELKVFAYSHAMGMLNYDGETTGPRDSRLPRGKTMRILSGEAHRLSTGPETLALLDCLREHMDELSPRDRRRVELWEKDLKFLQRVPVEEHMAYTELRNDSSAAWHDAKQKSDYALFEPYLARMIETKKRFAGLVEPEKDVYDYLLDKYEEGLTREKCDGFFAQLRRELVPLVEQVRDCEQPDVSCAAIPVPVHIQQQLAHRVMELIGIDRDRCSLGVTEHPFTTDFSKYDVRITTNYREGFVGSLYSVVHEGGHALYELHIADDLQFTSLAGGVSMSIHESQSRFFENLIGRSRAFITLLRPELLKLVPELERYSAEDLYRAANRAQPSLIRTEADELTYSLHIMVRYQIEKEIFSGAVTTKELPERWNDLYREYLGVEVPDDRRGVLQDSHWSTGLMGYFPSYALGSAYGAQLLARMEETVDVYGCVAAGNMKPIHDWLEERIWKYGCLVPPVQLIEQAFGGPFDPRYYTDYLRRKMADVYGF